MRKASVRNQHMHQLFIKYSETGLSEEEMPLITRWVNAYQDRKLMFQDLNEIMEFEKRLSIAQDAEIGGLLNDMGKRFPENYSDVSAQIGPFILRPALEASLAVLKAEITYKIIYGNKWIRVLAFLIRTALIILILFFILKIVFKDGL